MVNRRAPKRPYPRTARVNELLREILAEELERIDDDRLLDVAITSVRCEADLRHAVVHFDVLAGSEADAEVLAAFDELRRRLQASINRQARLKHTPELSFAPDPVVRSALQIEGVLRGLRDLDGDPDGQGPGATDEGPGSGGGAGTGAP